MIRDIKKALADYEEQDNDESALIAFWIAIEDHAPEWLSALVEYYEAAEADEWENVESVARIDAARAKLSG